MAAAGSTGQAATAADIPFVGGRLCLDFANTVDWHVSEEPVECLRTFADLVTWAERAGRLGPGARRHLPREGSAAAVRSLAAARALRDALFRLFLSAAEGRAPRGADAGILGRAAARASAHRELVAEGDRLAWRPVPAASPIERLLDEVALDAAALATSEELGRVRVCASEDGCGWLFLDTSRNRSRRWCDMAVCGNRSKARAHYERTRKEGR